MCGFSGFLGGVTFEEFKCKHILSEMTKLISHRGPDSGGEWIDLSAKIALGHRRLSILDLSPAGDQPMTSKSGKYVIVYNGEIYNHLALREELSSIEVMPHWSGHSDTETLLACFETWGIENTIMRCNGMFSFAVWCAEDKTLYLGRDRLGEKPLYFGWQDREGSRSFLFGSELKAFKPHPNFLGDIDRDALCLMMRYGYIPAPHSIYKGIHKLPPGNLLKVSLLDPEPKIWPYWSVTEVAINGVRNPFSGTEVEAIDSLELLLRDAVKRQMLSDVPLGAFLSGGVDSSTIVALMQAQSSRPVKTFTIGFNEEGYNEAVHAKAVANHLGTHHTELYVSPKQAMDVIPKLPSLYCEPFADSSQIPTYLVSQLAKQKVTVSLSGDAGDELFCGYNRYKLAAQLWRRLSLVPTPIRGITSKLITSISPYAWDRFGGIIPGGKIYAALGDKMHKGASVLASADFQRLYLGIVSQISNPTEWVIGGYEPPTKLIGNSPLLAEFSDIEKMMLLDTISYLSDDILVKVDRAAMGVSLEGRVPFLDHRIVEFAWTLPLDYKLRDGQTKWPLRQLLYRYVPKELIERPKMGFGVPIGDWLRGPLRDWAETLLAEDRLRRESYFHPEIIRSKWAEHLSGRKNWQSQLWTVLMFQAWLENEK